MTEAPESVSDVPVEVLCLSVTPALIRKGHVSRDASGSYDVVLDEPEPAFHSGMRVVLDGGPDSPLRVNGLVTETAGVRLRVEIAREVRPEKRAFPRLYGGLRVRYRVLDKSEEETLITAWLGGDDTLASDGVWHEPDPFMDFSGSGLKFEDQPHCRVNDLILLEMMVPPSKELWHATARVLRIESITPEEDEDAGDQQTPPATHRIAINFLDVPEKMSEALAAFTLRIQDALLRT